MKLCRCSIAFLLFLMLLCLVLPMGVHAAPAKAKPIQKDYTPFNEPRPKQPQEMVDDKRLDVKVKVFVKSKNMKDLFADLTARTGVEITANRELWGERPIIYFHSRPLRDVLTEISGLYGYHWLISGKPGAYEYELFEDMKHSQRREEAKKQLRAREGSLLLDLLNGCAKDNEDALGRVSAANKVVSDALSTPEGKSLTQAFNGLGQDMWRKAINEGNQTYNFDDLPEATQKALIQYCNQQTEAMKSQMALLGPPRKELPTFTYMDFAGYPVTIRMVDGGTGGVPRLSMATEMKGRGKYWTDWPPVSKANLGRDAFEKLTDRELEKAVGYTPAPLVVGDVPLPSEPKITATEPAKWLWGPSGLSEGDMLYAIARQSNMDIVADNYLHAEYSKGFRDKPLDKVVDDACVTCVSTCQVSDTTLRFRHNTWFLEPLMVEPPQEVLDAWWGKLEQSSAVELQDILELGRLSDAQAKWPGLRRIPLIAVALDYSRQALRLRASLTEDQLASAGTPGGLKVSEMADEQVALLTAWASTRGRDLTPDEARNGTVSTTAGSLFMAPPGAKGDELSLYPDISQAPGVRQGKTCRIVFALPDGRQCAQSIIVPPPLSEFEHQQLMAQRKADAEADVVEVLK